MAKATKTTKAAADGGPRRIHRGADRALVATQDEIVEFVLDQLKANPSATKESIGEAMTKAGFVQPGRNRLGRAIKAVGAVWNTPAVDKLDAALAYLRKYA